MALPSQSVSQNARGRYMYRRRRKHRIPMLAVTARSFGRGYSSEDHRGVTYLAMYWHFLDGAWVVLFLTLIWGAGGVFGA